MNEKQYTERYIFKDKKDEVYDKLKEEKGSERITKITFRTIADKYNIFEEDVERIFACYDTNDLSGMRSAIGYCFFCMFHSDVEFLFDIICYLKQCEIEQQQRKETKEMNEQKVKQTIDELTKLRKKLHNNIHHKNEWNKIPAITEYAPGSNKFPRKCLDWIYNDSEIHVESVDYNLISLIEDVIEMYLEETGQETNESVDYKPHKFKRSGYYEKRVE